MGPTDKLVAYFVRHGTTGANAHNAFRSHMDVPLTEKGVKDAEEAASFFKDKPVGDVYSSDLTRAVDTAHVIADPKGLSVSEHEDLRAWNLGYLAGQPKPEHKTEVQYYQDNPDEVPPRGESLHQYRARITPRIKQSIMKGITGTAPSLTVLHSSGIHELSHIIHGDHTFAKVHPGGIVGVYHGQSGLKIKNLFKGVHKGNGYGE